MSRFWGQTDDDDKSDDDYSSGSDDDQLEGQQQQPKQSRFLKGGAADDDSDDDDDDRRVVRSEKDKRIEQFQENIAAIRAKIKTNDWSAINNELDKLTKQIERSKAVITKLGVPPFVARILIEVDKAFKTTDASKEERRKLSKVNAKAFNISKQKIAKFLSTYKADIAAFNEAEAKKAAADDDNDDDDDEDAEWQWGAPEEKAPPVQEAKKTDDTWTREIVNTKLRELLTQRGKKGLDRLEQIRKLLELLSHADGIDQELSLWFTVIAAIFDTTTANTQMSRHYWTQAYRSLCTVVAILNENKQLVLQEAKSDVLEVSAETNTVTVIGSLIGLVTRLDDELTQSLQIVDPHSESYIQFLRDETKLVQLIERVQEYYERCQDFTTAAQISVLRMSHLYAKREWVHKALYDAEQYAIAHPEIAVESEKISAADLLPTKATAVDSDDEDAEDEQDEDDSLPVVAVVTEFKPIVVPARELPKHALGEPYVESRVLLKALSVLVFGHGDERNKTKAILYLIFHHALHDRYYEARDLLLMSHLQEVIHHVDIPTQILFNRALVQTGLCAFRAGLIQDAHSSLSDICSGGRIKELLAQGTSSRHAERSPEQERIEKARQIPYHMHINLELVECAHLISAMLLEVPNMAANAYDIKRKVISRPFRKLFDYFDRQTFGGPPENTRESVVAAARALSTGDWRAAAAFLLSLRVWRFMPDNDGVKEMLTKKLKEEGLRTYLFAYGAFYSSFSIDELSERFELPKPSIHSIVSKMMINDELRGSWDHPTSSIVMHNVEPSRLQALALQYTEKLATVVESNERVLDAKVGGYTGKYDARIGKDAFSRDRGTGGNNNRRYPPRDGNKREGRDSNNNNNNGNNNNNNSNNNSGGGDRRRGQQRPGQRTNKGQR